MKRLALSIVSLCAAFAAAKAEPPNTVWTVKQPASDGSYAYISDGTGWEFAVLKDGRLCPNKLTVGETTATELNFCTVPEINFGYTIREVFGIDLSSGKAATAAAKGLLKAVYFPSTVTDIAASSLSGYSQLEKCVLHPDCTNVKIHNTAFFNDPLLESFELRDGMTIGSMCFKQCPKLVLSGDVLPSTVTSLIENTFYGCQSGVFKDGKLVICGDDQSDMAWSDENGHGFFEGIIIRDLTFGAGVSSAARAHNTISPYYYKGQSTITNVVVRNPGTFAFNDVWTCRFSGQKGIRQYDLAGWVTGTLVGHSTARMTRIRAAKTADWRGLLNTAGSHQAWDSLTAAVQQSYWDNFNGGAVGTGDDVPVGLSNAITVNGLTLPANIWLVFKPGDWPAIKTLVVAGDPADWPAEASETTPFSPTYGLAADIVKSHGETFDATAPRYVVSADGKTLAETVAGTLYHAARTGFTRMPSGRRPTRAMRRDPLRLTRRPGRRTSTSSSGRSPTSPTRSSSSRRCWTISALGRLTSSRTSGGSIRRARPWRCRPCRMRQTASSLANGSTGTAPSIPFQRRRSA